MCILISTLLAGAGLSFSAGFNAYLPLLVLALVDRLGSSVNLDSPYSGISSNVGILILLLVLPIELIADKIPKLDHYNDVLHTAIRPLVGGFCFMAIASQDDALNVWIAGFIGVAVAATTHAWKMKARPQITAGTNGLGNPFVSVLEDGVVILVSVLSTVFPFANIVVVPLSAALVRRSYLRMAAGESRTIHAFQPKTRP
jgi:uncharacterized membrane protein